jgi:hypothetical protein
VFESWKEVEASKVNSVLLAWLEQLRDQCGAAPLMTNRESNEAAIDQPLVGMGTSIGSISSIGSMGNILIPHPVHVWGALKTLCLKLFKVGLRCLSKSDRHSRSAIVVDTAVLTHL